MKIMIEYDINNCYQCPFFGKFDDMGWNAAFVCDKLAPEIAEISKEGIRHDCPLHYGEIIKR